jgi:hypothetical protein
MTDLYVDVQGGSFDWLVALIFLEWNEDEASFHSFKICSQILSHSQMKFWWYVLLPLDERI